MENAIIDPNYEFEAPHFVNFSSVDDDEDAYADAWFDNKPDDEGGIQIPVDMDEKEFQKTTEEQRPKRKTVVVDVTLAEQEAPTIDSGEDNSTPNAAEITKKSEDAVARVESVTEELNSEVKQVVCGLVNAIQNDANVELVDSTENEAVDANVEQVDSTKNEAVEQSKNNELSSEENAVEPTNAAVEHETETAELSKSLHEMKAESEVESQKGGQTNSSESNDTAEEAVSKDQSARQQRRIKRASKRNRSLNMSASSDVPNKRKKPTTGGSVQNTRRTRSTCNSEMKTLSVTLPVTPQCLKRQKTNKPSMIKLKTTEELEMECIAKLRKQTKHHIKANENLMKKAISCPAVSAVRATGASLTRPQEFHFQTDRRVKQHPMATRADHQLDMNGEDMEKEFWKGLRQHPPSPSWKNRTATVPKPFNLSDGGQKKRKHSAMDTETTETDAYESMAYQVYKFQTRTPLRFRTRRSNDTSLKSDNESAPEKPATAPKSVTMPKTPNLSTKTRARPVPEDVLSKEEKEMKEAEEMKNFKFKAKPFDRRIVECDGMFGVKKPEEPIPATKPKPFLFESDERLVTRKEKAPADPNQEEPVNFKALPQPNFEKVFRPQLKHERTEPKPFSFEEKDKERWQKKEDKIQGVYKEEEKLREFRAQPLPSDSPDTLPAVSSKCGTSVKPFALNTENRGAMKAEKWVQKVKTEIKESLNKATFKAKPCKVVHDAPFVPQKSKKPLTEVSEFALNTNYRAERREELEVSKKEREEIDEELRREREAEREQEEQEAIALLRKQLVHKAQPIHRYKNVKVKPSSKPLTEAHSPAWGAMKRRRIETHR